jgi:hypothetical protein
MRVRGPSEAAVSPHIIVERTMNLACPKCTSQEVRKLSLIHNEGLSIINTQSQTVAFGGGAFGGVGSTAAAGTSTVGRQQTALSKQAAPPAKKHWILWATLAGFFALFTMGGLTRPSFGTLFTLIIAGLGVRFALQARKYNAEIHPSLQQQWERSFMCNRCGEVFVS